MRFDFLHAAQRLAALMLSAEIEGAPDAEFAQNGTVGCRQVSEMIGAEQLAPTHRAAVAGGIAAEIAEIAGAGEIEMAGRGF